MQVGLELKDNSVIARTPLQFVTRELGPPQKIGISDDILNTAGRFSVTGGCFRGIQKVKTCKMLTLACGAKILEMGVEFHRAELLGRRTWEEG